MQLPEKGRMPDSRKLCSHQRDIQSRSNNNRQRRKKETYWNDIQRIQSAVQKPYKISFRDKKHSNETELSKYIWGLKKSRRNFSLKWSILKRATAYQSGAKQCNLCLEEKLCVLKDPSWSLFQNAATKTNSIYGTHTAQEKNDTYFYPWDAI